MPSNASPEAWLYSAIQAAGLDVYPVTSPAKKEPPFAVYSRDSTDRDLETAVGSTGAVVGEFVVEIFSDGYQAGKTLADSVRAAVNNFTGTAGGATIDRVQLTQERDGVPVRLADREATTYVIEQTYLIEWNE